MIDLTYLDDLSRVRITLSGLIDLDTVQVQRSVNQLLWTVVRGGVALDLDAGAATLDDYEFVTDVVNHYRVVTVEPSGTVVELQSSILPSLHGQVWLKSIRFPFLNRPIDCANYGDIDRPARLSLNNVSGRSVPVAVSDLRESRRWTLSIVTRTQTEARDLDLALAAGDTMFVHVPPEDVQLCQRVKLIPGGYVEIDTTTQRRRGLGGTVFQWLLPMTVVAPPGPDVVGGTMTYQGLLNLFGDYQNMIGTSLTYAELTELVGDPEDVVVP